VYIFNRNEVESTDKTKSKKNWLFHKKKASSVCTSNTHSKSPEIPIFLPGMMKQLMTLIDFLEKDESEICTSRTTKFMY